MNNLLKGKVTIFERNLPLVAMDLTHLRRFHAKMLRQFARCSEFRPGHLTIRIKVRDGDQVAEFNSLTAFHQAFRNRVPDSIELSYQYANMVLIHGSATDVLVMNCSVLFGDTGRNECYITSNDEQWAEQVYDCIMNELTKYANANWAKRVKTSAFCIALASLVVFGLKLFPFASAESFITMLAFFLSSIIVAWPNTFFPFKQLAQNRIVLN